MLDPLPQTLNAANDVDAGMHGTKGQEERVHR